MDDMTTVETYGRWTFTLERGEEKTTRTISIPSPKDPIQDEAAIETVVSNVKSTFTQSTDAQYFIQPANWRDDNAAEAEWHTTGVKFDVVTTSVTSFE